MYLTVKQKVKHLSKDEYKSIKELSHIAKNLTNEAIYNCRQYYFNEGLYLNYEKNYTLLKKGELSYNHGNSKLAKYGVVFELKEYEEALVPKVYHSFRVNQLADAKFIEIMFSTKIPDRELGKLVSSGARMDGLLNISFDDFMNIAIVIPTFAEQQAIGAYFSNLDNLISAHKEKISQLETLKKKLLQDMFI